MDFLLANWDTVLTILNSIVILLGASRKRKGA